MAYSVKEIYYTLQGEGARAGRASVFCRFSGCNLWSGREEDRASAACDFCDTDFIGMDGPGGGRFATAVELAERIASCWREAGGSYAAAESLDARHDESRRGGDAGGSGAIPYVVFTGGEPLLQLDVALLDACRALGLETAVETNGTITPPPGIDWLTVSPKPRSQLVVRSGDEMKLVYPHAVHPEAVEDLDFRCFFLQPMDGPELAHNVRLAVDYCRRHPRWRLSLQMHKLAGIP